MIHETYSSKQSNNILLQSFSALKVSSLLRSAGIRKSKGIPVLQVFKFLVLLVFQGKNLYRFIASTHESKTFSKNSFYRLLNATHYNWRRFLHELATKVISFMNSLTCQERVKVLILDDTITPRSRSKSVELLAKVFDHTVNKFKKGFTMLTLGWSDGYSFIPVDFAMLSSAKKSNRYNEINKDIDKRTNGYKRRKESIKKKSEVAIELIKHALNAGVQAAYVLMDSWFTHEPLIKACLDEGIDVIGIHIFTQNSLA